MTELVPRQDAQSLTIRTITSLSEVDRAAWDTLANPPGEPHNPFVSWDFLELLERSHCVSDRTGWQPMHILAETDDGALVGAAPAYLKSHSQGEFVFDYGWANAYERAGGQYYPKLQIASPFTPVTGPRILTPSDTVRAALFKGIEKLSARLGLSSFHVTFPPEHEWRLAGEQGLLQRTDQQFMWFNRGYESFDDFLAALASRKRKNFRKERAAAQDGLTIVRLSGRDLTESHWDAFYAFYLDTGSRKWGSPYLNREAFALLHERMADRCLMVLAYDGATPIAGALNIVGGDALYGRYWGAIEHRPFLHFELCYYQAIDEAIERRLPRVEAGAQGGHKMARGYEPTPVYSYHWIAHEGFRAAIADYLERERDAVEHDIEVMQTMTPFKKGG